MESYLDHHADKLTRRFDANSYLVLTESMNSHDVGRGRGGVARRPVPRDRGPGRGGGRLRPALPPAAVRGDRRRCRLGGRACALITSDYGHDGFLIEIDQVGRVVRDTLTRLRTR